MGTICIQRKRKRYNSFTVELDNKASELFDVMYQAHIQDIGWMDWVRNGAAAGTTGEQLRIIQRMLSIRLSLTE